MDSIEITIQRTGAATAVAAKYLARPESETLTICGCGNQGRVSLRALTNLFPIKTVFAYDSDADQTQRFAHEMTEETGISVEAVNDLKAAIVRSDIVLTCTPAKQFFLKREWVRPGTFVAEVGADSEYKQELESTLLSQNRIVVDMVEQAATIGELHHAIEANLMTRDHVHAELGEVVAGGKPGRSSSDEIIIFDSTGMALQDVIVAAAVYEKAVDNGLGQSVDFGGENINRASAA